MTLRQPHDSTMWCRRKSACYSLLRLWTAETLRRWEVLSLLVVLRAFSASQRLCGSYTVLDIFELVAQHKFITRSRLALRLECIT